MSWNDVRLLVADAVKSVKTKSALQPLLWLVALVSLPCICLAVLNSLDTWIRIVLLLMGFFPIGALLAAYTFWSLKDPDRLHSEEFILRNRALDITESKGKGISVSEIDISSIIDPNPQSFKQIPPPKEDDIQKPK